MIPLHLFKMEKNRHTLFYLIKLIRLLKGFEILDVGVMMKYIKIYFFNQLQKLVDTNSEKANTMLEDHTPINEILVLGYILKSFRLFIDIANLTYLIAIFWWVMLRLLEEDESHTFITEYNLNQKTVYENVVIVIYWAFTSLSTVGFGDFAPISDTERVIGAFILLLGVAIFSYIMGNFIEIINDISQWNRELEDDDNLNKFFGVIAKYNGNEDMDSELKNKIN